MAVFLLCANLHIPITQNNNQDAKLIATLPMKCTERSPWLVVGFGASKKVVSGDVFDEKAKKMRSKRQLYQKVYCLITKNNNQHDKLIVTPSLKCTQ